MLAPILIGNRQGLFPRVFFVVSFSTFKLWGKIKEKKVWNIVFYMLFGLRQNPKEKKVGEK